MEEELRDVVMEARRPFARIFKDRTNISKANALAPNWGQTIFQSANEIAAGTMFRSRLDEIQAQTESEKEWWEKRRASIQSEFMKELDTPASSTGKASKVVSDDDAVLVETASNTGSMKKKKGKK
jgi:translocation protein SEC66